MNRVSNGISRSYTGIRLVLVANLNLRRQNIARPKKKQKNKKRKHQKNVFNPGFANPDDTCNVVLLNPVIFYRYTGMTDTAGNPNED